jgi:hypothetical protein
MNDTSDKVAAMVRARHEAMTIEERLQITSQMFETARQFVEASLASHLSRYERRLAYIKRFQKRRNTRMRPMDPNEKPAPSGALSWKSTRTI